MRKIAGFIGACFLFSLVGCCPPINSCQPVKINNKIKTTKVVNLQSVKYLSVSGQFAVNMTVGAKSNRLTIVGSDADFANISITRNNSVLYVCSTADKPLTKTLKVNIAVKTIKGLTLGNIKRAHIRARKPAKFSMNLQDTSFVALTGKFNFPILTIYGKTNTKIQASKRGGRVNIGTLNNKSSKQLTINNLRATHLNINDTGGGNTILHGYANVGRISKTVGGLVDVSWIKSKRVIVQANGTSIISLAGVTDRLDAYPLYESSKLHARYLRAGIVHVQTFGHALAEVKALKQLFITAKDHSMVKYYGSPPPLFYHRYFGQAVIVPILD